MKIKKTFARVHEQQAFLAELRRLFCRHSDFTQNSVSRNEISRHFEIKIFRYSKVRHLYTTKGNYIIEIS